MAALTAPGNYASIPLDFRTSASSPSANSTSLRLPIQVRQEREAARASLAAQPAGRAYTPFFVPESILCKDNDAQPSEGQQDAPPLLRLPVELLLLIVQRVEVPHFQVVLGLTCKKMARLMSDNREMLGVWRGFRDKEGLYRLLSRQGPQVAQPAPPKAKSLLRQHALSLAEELEAMSVRASPLPTTACTTYIPGDLRLCRACYRHLPHSSSAPFWRLHPLLNSSTLEDDYPHINWFDVVNFFAPTNTCGQHKCPECVVRGYQAFVSEREYERALAEDWREEEVWLCDLGGDGGRRVCLELAGRLGRP